MAVLVDGNTRVLVQGLGRDGSFQARRMMDYGTHIAAAVHPNRAGQKFDNTVPYFETVEHAVRETGANAGIIFVPAPAAPDAIVEQIDAGLPLSVCITEGIPVQDMARVKRYLDGKDTILIGPNCPGLITPAAKTKLGIIPHEIVVPGTVGVVSRSGTLTYAAIDQLVNCGIGQTTCIGIGGDPVHGFSFVDALRLLEADDETEAIVLIGEIGGSREQEAADYIKRKVSKPVVATIVGQTAPTGKRMGHAGAVIVGEAGLASSKIAALRTAGVHIAESATAIGETMRAVLGR